MNSDSTAALAQTNRVLRTLRAGHRTLLRAGAEQDLLQSTRAPARPRRRADGRRFRDRLFEPALPAADAGVGHQIDQSFVSRMVDDPESAAIVRSTVELCHALYMRAIAEGVEDEPAWQALSAIGCDSAQGYYVGKPLPVADYPAWATASRWSPATAGKVAQ